MREQHRARQSKGKQSCTLLSEMLDLFDQGLMNRVSQNSGKSQIIGGGGETITSFAPKCSPVAESAMQRCKKISKSDNMQLPHLDTMH